MPVYLLLKEASTSGGLAAFQKIRTGDIGYATICMLVLPERGTGISFLQFWDGGCSTDVGIRTTNVIASPISVGWNACTFSAYASLFF